MFKNWNKGAQSLEDPTLRIIQKVATWLGFRYPPARRKSLGKLISEKSHSAPLSALYSVEL